MVDGGFVLSGRWSFSSGADHCSWALLGALVQDAEGAVVDFRTFCCRASSTRSSTCGTSSGCAAPAPTTSSSTRCRAARLHALDGDTGQCKGPGQEVNTAELYRLPFHSIFTSTIAAPLIGMARGVYAEHVEMQQNRRRAAYLGERASLDPFAAVRLARASSEIDAAWALLTANLREEQDHVARGEQIPLEVRLRVRRDQVLGSERAIEAIDTLFEASGGRALADGTYLQRQWRKRPRGSGPRRQRPRAGLQMYGAQQFGHTIDPGMY